MSGMTTEDRALQARLKAEREAAESVVRRAGGKGPGKATRLRNAKKHLKVK